MVQYTHSCASLDGYSVLGARPEGGEFGCSHSVIENRGITLRDGTSFCAIYLLVVDVVTAQDTIGLFGFLPDEIKC